jgi:hypothetical protein
MVGIYSAIDDPNANTATGPTFPKLVRLNGRPEIGQGFVRTDSSFQLRHA